MSTRTAPVPDRFDFSAPQKWPLWRERFSTYRLATKLHKEDGEVQVAALKYALGPDAEPVFLQLQFDADADKKDFDKVLKKFGDYFTPKTNLFHKRMVFERAAQRPGETVEEFLRRLHVIAETCQFGNNKSDRIRDRFVATLLDEKLATDLQLTDNLTLEKATEKARGYELVRQQVASQRGHASATPASAAVAGASAAPRKSTGSFKSKSDGPAGSQSHNLCMFCGGKLHTRDRCPARDVTCRSCSKKGHYARVCRSSKKGSHSSSRQSSSSGAHSLATQDDPGVTEDWAYLDLDSIASGSSPWMCDLLLYWKSVPFKIDTGADITVITPATYESLKSPPPLSSPTTRLTGANGDRIDCKGTFSATLSSPKLSSSQHQLEIHVLTRGKSNLLSREASQVGFVFKGISEAKQPPLGRMLGEPVKIALRPDAVPYQCSTARRVPIPILPKVKAELVRMEAADVITKITEPTDWCAPMVPVAKKNGDVRICVDLRRLNASVRRETFILPTVNETLAKLSGATCFTTLDAAKGFWQVPLDAETAKLTTFITPFGRYYFRRLPFGITSEPEIFQRKLMQYLDGLPGVCVFMDDILVFGATVEEHDATLEKVRSILRNVGVALNPDKEHVRQSSVEFLGHVVSADGVSPSQQRLAAISELQAPADLPALRRVLGIFNYLSKFLPEMGTVSQPLRLLLRADTVWCWDAPQEEAFQRLKQLASQSPCLAFYDVSKPTLLRVDASGYGLGAVLLQQQSAGWQPVARDLDRVPLRYQRLLLRLARFDVTAEHVPGHDLVVADALSRAPLPTTVSTSSVLTDEIASLADSAGEEYMSSGFSLALRDATQADRVLQQVAKFVQSGWPDHSKDVPADVLPYFADRQHLSVANVRIFYGARVVVPASLRDMVIRKLHTSAHHGIVKCQAQARQSVWWPSWKNDVASAVTQCRTCCQHRSQPPEPLRPTEFPSLPWQRVGSDLCQFGNTTYLVVVDYYSRYVEALPLRSTTSASVITAMKAIFARHGVPETLVTDNGPQYASDEFARFSCQWNFDHVTSSPHHPQSNGEAERAVRTIKQLLAKSDDFQLALLTYRSTPLQSGFSPSQLLMCRSLRGTLPVEPSTLLPTLPAGKKLRELEQHRRAQSKDNFDKRHRTKPLQPLQPVYKLDAHGTLQTFC
ncbi:uncharacterized protein K02A2.6-like [Sycon ciliatum]|uniref:uncharacterized protein K02A2.6-like n=1 Tax=Sycon ciliatum TaxID=27933 RepID=UPI0031F6AB7C